MTTKNYTSIYNIEEYILKNIMPLYFNQEEINTINIGLQGQMTHMISDATEDLSNMVTAVYTEMTPNTAVLPSTIYSNAALYRVDDIFAVPAELNILFMIREEELINNSEVVSSGTQFVLDRDTVINIDGLDFMFDNDIIIHMKNYKGTMKYIVRYSDDYTNSLSNDLTSPYLQTIKFSYEDGSYLGIYTKVRQVSKYTHEESIINNQSINFPRINITFDEHLAGFEVFYKSIDSDKYIQLSKVLKNSAPLETPFCYYTMEDEKEFEITFSSRERYFTPDFNAEIRVEYYTTKGLDGNFEKFTGNLDDIEISLKTTRYPNNGKLICVAIPQNGAIGGLNSLTFDELKNKVMLKFSTIGTIITENDLQLYFADINDMQNIKMLFKKKRDDIYRLFSAFSYYVNRSNIVMHTHTLNSYINTELLDRVVDDSVCDIIKPGTIFEYRYPDEVGNTDVTICKNQNITNFTNYDHPSKYIYTNPFLINIMHEPNNVVGLYLNSIDSSIPMSYTYTSIDAENQFLCSSFKVERNALKGDDSYEFRLVIAPATALTIDVVDKLGNFLDNIVTKVIFMDGGEDIGYIDLDFFSYTSKIGTVEFVGRLKTDDCLTISEKIRCTNLKDMVTGEEITRVIPYLNTECKVCIFSKEESSAKYEHQYTHLENLIDYRLTNIYTTMENKLNLVLPFSFIRTFMEYEQSDNVYGYNINLSEVPLVSAYDLQEESNFEDIVALLKTQYNYFTEVVPKLENSYSIDLKFIGTYGKSKLFNTELEDLLDSINCKIEFNIYPFSGVDTEILRNRINIIISDYFDSINITGDKSIKVSNLMQQIDSVDEVDYLKFVRINNYDSNVQVLINNTPEITDSGYNAASELNFIPEYVTIRPEDIILNIIE